MSEDSANRICHLKRSDNGYGFHLHGEKGKVGQIIKQVEEGSVAETSGLKAGDRLIAVNGENVESCTHQEVVAKIKANPEETTLEVADPEIQKPEDEAPVVAQKTENGEQNGGSVHTVEVNEPSANKENVSTDDDDKNRPRFCVLEKEEGKGFGFNLHSEKGKPGRYIRSVDDGGVAEKSGLKAGDRIIEVNGNNMENEKHVQVVSAIKESGNTVSLLVVDETADTYFKKCETTPAQAHIEGPLPKPKTTVESEDLLTMDLTKLKEKSQKSVKKGPSASADWRKRADIFNSM